MIHKYRNLDGTDEPLRYKLRKLLHLPAVLQPHANPQAHGNKHCRDG